MHSLSGNGTNARAYYTAGNSNDARTSAEFKDSKPFMGKAFMLLEAQRGREAGAGQAVAQSVEGVNGDYHSGWNPSPGGPSALGNVDNQRRLPTPPLQGDSPFRPLVEWHALERAHERPVARNPIVTPQLLHYPRPRGQIGVGTPPQDTLPRVSQHPLPQHIATSTPWVLGQYPHGGTMGTGSPHGLQLPRTQGHMPQLLTSPYYQKDERHVLPPVFPILEAAGRDKSAGDQHQPRPTYLASSPFQPSPDTRLPPIQNWTVTPRPSVQSVPPRAAIADRPRRQEDVLDEVSARKQAAYKEKAARKRAIRNDTHDPGGSVPVPKHRRTKAAKVEPATGKRGRLSKSRQTNVFAQHAHAPNPVPAHPDGLPGLPPGCGHRPYLMRPPGHDHDYGAPSGSGSDPFDPDGSAYFPVPQPIPSAYAQWTAPPMFVPGWDSCDQPIVNEYDNYKWSVKLYQIDPVKTRSDSAEAWLESTVFSKLTPPANKRHVHSTKGFIGGDGNLLNYLMLHNASNPFSTGHPETSTTTVGVYGLHWKGDSLIRWTTFSPTLRFGDAGSELKQAEAQGLTREVRKWGPDMKASDKRFHRAYWMCANMLPLGNLLNHEAWSPTVNEEAGDGEDDGFDMTEADVRNNDLGLSEADSIAAWNGVLEALESYGPVGKPGARSGDHKVLWSSEWGVRDVWR